MNSEASHSWQKANITLFSVGSGLDSLECLAETQTRRFLASQSERNKDTTFFFFFFTAKYLSSLLLTVCWMMAIVPSIRRLMIPTWVLFYRTLLNFL